MQMLAFALRLELSCPKISMQVSANSVQAPNTDVRVLNA